MVSIIIISYNQKELLERCIKNIFKINVKPEFEVIVVDNNSKDKTRKYLKGLKNDKLSVIYNDKNLGYAAANNQAIKISKGDAVLLLNPDVKMLPNSVSKLYDFLKNNENVGMVGPRLLNPDGSTQNSCCRFPKIYTPIARRTCLAKLPFLQKELNRYLMKDVDHEKNQEVDWMIGACLMIKKEVLKKIGYLDERYFLYFEDVDLARQIKKLGKSVYYLSDVKVVHDHQRLSAHKGVFSKVVRIHILSGIKYFLKWGLTN
ncbi:MAG TPA: glycosyltransferase family 2 protein [Patescibacteria group bacterium]|nr:glycosyltransferase family 2 protein [Patescibacteria group bacterium]